MERRKTRRQPVAIQAVLSTLHEENGETRKGPPLGVVVEEISGRGARVRLPLRLRPGTLVQMEAGDDLFLGEIVHCRSDGDGYVAGMEVDCVLHTAAGLRELMKALLEEGYGPSGSDAAEAHVERHNQHGRQCRQQYPA